MAQQQDLFEREPTPWELDRAVEQTVAAIVFPEPPFGPLDYAVPPELRDNLGLGSRVRVPLGRGNRQVSGYCVGLSPQSGGSRQLKDVASVLDERTLFSAHMIRLTEWMSEYYLCEWGQALEAVVPAGVRAQAGTREQTFLADSPTSAVETSRCATKCGWCTRS